jgi:hypothetical protein
VKKRPRRTVVAKEEKHEETQPAFSEAWDQVIVRPEQRRTTVLRRGREKASKGMIPGGGHVEPNSTLGESAQCRYAQKKPKKKKISEAMKRSIPRRKPDWTRVVCEPRKVDSKITSYHQKREAATSSSQGRKTKSGWGLTFIL